MLFDDTAHSSSCPLLLSFLFNVNIIPATLSTSELAVVVPELGLGRRAGGWRQVPLQCICTQKMNKIMKKSFYMCIHVHDRVQRSNAVVYRVV